MAFFVHCPILHTRQFCYLDRMDNKRIIKYLDKAVALLNLHEVNPFKVRAWESGVAAIEAAGIQLASATKAELESLLGKSMAEKVSLLIQTGSIPEIAEVMAATPMGVQEMMGIKGLGPKRLRTIWREHGIETIAALQAACEANEVAKWKGFGEKTQASILQALMYTASSKGKYHLATVWDIAHLLRDHLAAALGLPAHNLDADGSAPGVYISGEVRQQADVVSKLSYVIGSNLRYDEVLSSLAAVEGLVPDVGKNGPFTLHYWFGEEQLPVTIHLSNAAASILFRTSAAEGHQVLGNALTSLKKLAVGTPDLKSEHQLYERAGLPYIIPAMRQGHQELDWAKANKPEYIMQLADVKGVLHNHSTWSDGAHSVAEMAEACKQFGWQYLGMADHSQSAFYANGLREDRVLQQQKEIDALNTANPDFWILKGIESDILADGSLDYPAEVLATFDYVVASVHSGLQMDIVKATDRLIKAISNPFTTILGHPSGRLLLRREAYPFDVPAVIEACKAHGVAIELNANPWRLDLDWRWLWQAQQAGVMISIGPDAHYTHGLADYQWGIRSGQKAGLLKGLTLNTMSAEELRTWIAKKRDLVASHA